MSRREPSSRRSALAVGLSAFLHLAALAWLVTRAPEKRPLPEVDRAPVLDVEIDAEPAPQKAASSVPASDHRSAQVHRRAAKAASGSNASAKTPAPASADLSQPPGPLPPGSAPQRLELGVPEVLLPHLAGELDDLEGGHTFREDPRAHGRSDREKAQEAQARIDGWLEDAEAERHVDIGLVDPWFGELKKRFEHDAADPKTAQRNLVGRMASTLAKSYAKSYVEGMQSYGATGSPGARSSGSSSLLPFAGTGVNDQFPMPPVPQLAPTGSPGLFSELTLITVVDLRQDSEGALLSAEIVARSGDADFDRFVLDIIPKSMEMVAPPPDAGLGFHDHGSHTVWEFAGRLAFMRDVKNMNLARDGWFVLPGALINGVKFDETTGFIGMTSAPYYKCQVRLLRVY